MSRICSFVRAVAGGVCGDEGEVGEAGSRVERAAEVRREGSSSEKR